MPNLNALRFYPFTGSDIVDPCRIGNCEPIQVTSYERECLDMMYSGERQLGVRDKLTIQIEHARRSGYLRKHPKENS